MVKMIKKIMRMNKIFLLTTLLIAIGVIVFFCYAFYMRNVTAEKYDYSIECIDNGKYDEAIKILSAMIDYKESSQLIEEAKKGKDYQGAQKLIAEKKYEDAIKKLEGLGDYKDAKEICDKTKYEYAKVLFEQKQYSKAKELFEKLGNYEDSKVYFAKCDIESIDNSKRLIYNAACSLQQKGKYREALKDFLALGDYMDSDLKVEEVSRLINAKTIAAGVTYSMGVSKKGRVVTAGDNLNGRCDVFSWKNIISIDGFGSLTIGLKENGTVEYAGNIGENVAIDVSKWKNIIDVAAGERYIVGLERDGTVLAQGHNGDGQTDVKKWKNVADITTGWRFTVGLTKKGRLLFAGYDNGQREEYLKSKSEWEDVIAIEAGGAGKGSKCKGAGHTVGLRSDGTVVAVGDNKYHQCEVSKWRDIVAIAAGDWYTVGLKSNGTVLITGHNEPGNEYIDEDIYKWKNIVDVAAGFGQTLGLKKNGSVVAIGYNTNNEREGTLSWPKIKVK